MTEKQILSRIIQKHDIETNWNKATNFVPMRGELIVYDIDANYDYERLKIGDGTTSVVDLPFTGGVDATARGLIGDLTTLRTEAQTDLVSAVNELVASVVTIDATLTQSGQAADAAAVGDRLSALSEEIDDKVTNPTTGFVGQILEIEAVDENGKPITYKSVDKPIGGDENKLQPIKHELDIVNNSKALQKLFDKGTLISNESETAHGGCVCGDMANLFALYTQNNVGSSVDYGNGSGACSVNVRNMHRRFDTDVWTYENAVELFKSGDNIYNNEGTEIIHQMIDAGDASCAYFGGKYYLSAMPNITSGSYGSGRFPVTREVSTEDTTGIAIGNGYYAGIAKAWSLTIDGEKGEFDFSRINVSYKSNPQTNFEPCLNTNGDKLYGSVVCDGKAVCVISSTNMLDWTLEAVYEYEHGYLESSMICGGWRGFIIAVRTQIGVTHIILVNSDLSIGSEFDLASGEGKPCFITLKKTGYFNNSQYWKLFVNDENRNVMTGYQIESWNGSSQITVSKIGTWKNSACNYLNIIVPSSDKCVAIGTNGAASNMSGVSVLEFLIGDMLTTEEKETEDEETGSSSSSGSETWELIERYTIASGDTSHKTELSKKYKKLYIFMNSVYASDSSDFRVMGDTTSVSYNAMSLAQVSLTTTQYKYSNIEIEEIVSGRVCCRQSNQVGNNTLGVTHYWNALTEKMPEQYLYFGLKSSDVTLSGGIIEIYGIPKQSAI